MSLSPGSVRSAASLQRLVLPSPNGSAICARLAGSAATVLGVSLRNRQSAAEWLLARRMDDPALRVAVVAAGERWPDGTLRPVAEDLWGCGALVDALCSGGWRGVSPEARLAAAAFRAVAGDLGTALRECASGRELIEAGYADDVRIAGERDFSGSVPILRGAAFTAT